MPDLALTMRKRYIKYTAQTAAKSIQLSRHLLEFFLYRKWALFLPLVPHRVSLR